MAADVPPRRALRWVEQCIGPGARVVALRRLAGGITSAVHALDVVDRDDLDHHLVLRRWAADVPGTLAGDGAVDRAEATALVERESHALQALEGHDVAAPRLIAHDPTGAAAGAPALLMARVPGEVDLAPQHPARWLGQLAAVLARIHGLAIDAAPFERWYEPARAGVPPGAGDPDVWLRAHDAARVVVATGDLQTFIHRDFQHFNVLWHAERLTGVVDWVNAATGPPALDVGHCRLNLAVLFSAEWAERFRLAYEAETGRTVDPRWDITALLSFGPEWASTIAVQVAGRAPVDAEGMVGRVEAVLAAALDRL
jgi:aminoglycoside phosphotransferase (APT) family kinase protein